VPCTQVIEMIKSSSWTYGIGSGTILPKQPNRSKQQDRRRLGRRMRAIQIVGKDCLK
jgi:hypothetical protein